MNTKKRRQPMSIRIERALEHSVRTFCFDTPSFAA